MGIYFLEKLYPETSLKRLQYIAMFCSLQRFNHHRQASSATEWSLLARWHGEQTVPYVGYRLSHVWDSLLAIPSSDHSVPEEGR